MKPSERYQSLLKQSGFEADSSQQAAVLRLDELFDRLLTQQPVSWFRRKFLSKNVSSRNRGIYFWGGVGRGKTLLMDLFYQAICDKYPAQRIHFHRFMNEVHGSLRALSDTTDPLQLVAKSIAKKCHLLCLDEFVIIDIGDAMIMAGLLEFLFAEGVVLVTTSNAKPENLYKDGLQRARFLPAIDLIERNCEVFNLDSEQDYRLRFLSQTDLYRVPHDDHTDVSIRQSLSDHVMPVRNSESGLRINGRQLEYRFCAEDTVWFHFSELCETPRSQNDFLELARLFSTLILTDIRQMNHNDDDIARRFVLLIDVLYDHQVKLICSAAVQPNALYQGERLQFEFERTSSRLLEMQSNEYLARAHTHQ
ncbi:MAG: cell division protein ZapE [Pseudomonadota bacterium]